MPSVTSPTPEDNAKAIAELRSIAEDAIACIPRFEQRWADLDRRLQESEQRERQAIELLLAQSARAHKATVKSARISERTSKIVLGVFLLGGIAALFVIYGDPVYLQEELQRWYPIVIPAMLWAALELFGVDYQRPLEAIVAILGFTAPTTPTTNGTARSTNGDEQEGGSS